MGEEPLRVTVRQKDIYGNKFYSMAQEVFGVIRLKMKSVLPMPYAPPILHSLEQYQLMVYKV
jgi:hypothetical protein